VLTPKLMEHLGKASQLITEQYDPSCKLLQTKPASAAVLQSLINARQFQMDVSSELYRQKLVCSTCTGDVTAKVARNRNLVNSQQQQRERPAAQRLTQHNGQVYHEECLLCALCDAPIEKKTSRPRKQGHLVCCSVTMPV